MSCVTFALNQNYTYSFGCEGHYIYFLKLKVTGKKVFKKAMVSLGGHFMPSFFFSLKDKIKVKRLIAR